MIMWRSEFSLRCCYRVSQCDSGIILDELAQSRDALDTVSYCGINSNHHQVWPLGFVLNINICTWALYDKNIAVWAISKFFPLYILKISYYTVHQDLWDLLFLSSLIKTDGKSVEIKKYKFNMLLSMAYRKYKHDCELLYSCTLFILCGCHVNYSLSYMWVQGIVTVLRRMRNGEYLWRWLQRL